MLLARCLPIVLPTLFSISPVFAQFESEEPEVDEEIVVWGRATELLGEADSASHGVVGYADFSTRPMMRVGELVEVIPGMMATQHSGSGKANQYFLRGINLDHGSDFSARFDGMPVNMRTHAHASGYLDLNFMIPEIIEKVEYRKGPYYAEMGDFSAAGGSMFKTYDSLDEGFVQVDVGTQEDYRLVAANSFEFANGDLLVAGEFYSRNGPWELEENLEKYNGMVKYTGIHNAIDTRLSLMAYSAQWNSTNQVPLRALESGLISRFGFIDPDLGGNSSRYTINGGLARKNYDIGAYISYYDMNLINNPTYFLDDPINGDEFEQEDRRLIYGLTANYYTETTIGDFDVLPKLGFELRYDDVGKLNLFNTAAHERIGIVRQDEAQELSLSFFGQAQVYVTDKLRTTFGLRWDYYDYDIIAFRLENSGSGSDSLLQPKFAIAYSFNNHLEFYGNYGIGFHSNDTRGAVITVDPVSGDPATPVCTLVEADGAEIGMRIDAFDGFRLTLAGFWLELESELLFVGDAGTSEPGDATRRIGVEADAFWEVNDWLVLDAAITKINGKFKGLPDDQNNIPDAHGFTASAGVTIVTDDGWTGSLRLRHFGDAPLIEDGSVDKKPSTLLNLGISKDFGKYEIGLDILNLLDSDEDDVDYFFESQLAGEPAPVEDIHFHPTEDRAFKLSVRYKF